MPFDFVPVHAMSFIPLPLLGNPHVQTVLGNLLPGVPRTLRVVKRLVALADGDHIVLHETPPLRSPRHPAPIALLVHGLGGSHRSAYMARVANRLIDLGGRVFRMDLRGAGAGLRHARRFYNAACSADVRAVVEYIAGAYPTAPIAVLGFSLGGNIALKFAGEMGQAMPPSVCAIVALAPPIDLIRCSQMIEQYPLYDSFYVSHLTSQVAQHQASFPELPRVEFPRQVSLRQFDEIYTAPRWGFADALDYYAKASSAPLIPAIRVPTFILTSRDDPFVAVEPFERLPPMPTLELHITDHGGHMGFLGGDGAGGIRWAETRIADWLMNKAR